MKQTFPRLTEHAISDWVGQRSLNRGRSYASNGALSYLRQAGMVLKATCQGSMDQPYRVQVTLSKQGIAASDCSCPVGGACKHVAAVLLAWLRDPAQFLAVAALEVLLEQRSKAELISLISKMVDRHPELEFLVSLPTPGQQQRLLDQATLRQQIQRLVGSKSYYDWESISSITAGLAQFLALGDEYAQADDWPNAVIVYATTARELLTSEIVVQDDEGDLGNVVNECAEGLGDCLAALSDEAQREGVLQALFAIYRWDVDYGGIGIGDEVPTIVLQEATPAERQRMTDWIRAAMPTGDSWGHTFSRQRYGHFLLELEADLLDDEQFLAICRQTGRLEDLLDRLLALGRLDEALAELRSLKDIQLLQMNRVFSIHNQIGQLETIIRERLKSGNNPRLIIWLKDQLQQRGNLAEALILAEQLFWQGPGLPGYTEIKTLAEPLGQWPALRQDLQAGLVDPRHAGLLTEIHLADQEIEAALASFGKLTAPAYGMYGTPLIIRVAQAAEATHPKDAISLYMEHVTRLIAARGRENYQTAAGYLVRVRQLFEQAAEQAAWSSLIQHLRDQNRSLPALKEELKRAGL